MALEIKHAIAREPVSTPVSFIRAAQGLTYTMVSAFQTPVCQTLSQVAAPQMDLEQ
jgi:hypothetical protein